MNHHERVQTAPAGIEPATAACNRHAMLHRLSYGANEQCLVMRWAPFQRACVPLRAVEPWCARKRFARKARHGASMDQRNYGVVVGIRDAEGCCW
jgi:hypothetical protein